MAATTDDILTVAEAAAHARCSPRTIYRAIKSGALVVSGIGSGRHYRIRRSNLLLWMDASVVRSKPVPVLVKAGKPVTGSAASLRAIERDAA